MATKRDFYEILGLDKKASQDDIKKAYRKLALQYHPDRNPGDKNAEVKFREATEAYEILSDASKRAQYDQFGHASTQGQHGFGNHGSMDDIFEQFGDIFEGIFGKQAGRRSNKKSTGPTPQRGHDLSQTIEISLRESYLGCAKEVKIYHFEQCKICQGNGCKAGSKPSICSQCQGSGSVVHRQGFFAVSQVCGTCHGQGFKITDPCAECRGQSRIQKHEKISINIPAGIYNNAELRILGKGDAGIFGGPSGDLYVTVSVQEDKRFSRKDYDLVTTLSLTYPQLVLGCQIEIENIDGSKEIIKIARGCPVGKEIIIVGKGFTKLRSHGRGNLVIITTCDIPSKLSNDAKDALLSYAERLGNESQQQSSGISGFFKKFLG